MLILHPEVMPSYLLTFKYSEGGIMSTHNKFNRERYFQFMMMDESVIVERVLYGKEQSDHDVIVILLEIKRDEISGFIRGLQQAQEHFGEPVHDSHGTYKHLCDEPVGLMNS